MIVKHKPYAPAADRNKDAILEALLEEIGGVLNVLETGSGSGQHLCHFASQLPNVRWQPSDLADKLPGINAWIADSGCRNIEAPIELDIEADEWPDVQADLCFTANTLHIVSWSAVESLFRGCERVLAKDEKLVAYGPIREHGVHTSQSNADFDQMLRASDPPGGVRDIEKLDQLAAKYQFSAARKVEMPVNNYLMIWQRL